MENPLESLSADDLDAAMTALMEQRAAAEADFKGQQKAIQNETDRRYRAARRAVLEAELAELTDG